MSGFRASHLVGLVVLAILLLYVLGSLGVVPASRELVLIPFLALGPLGVVGVVELGRLLSPGGSTVLTRAGTAFGIVGFALWEVVVVVQNGTRELWRQFIVPELRDVLPGGVDTVRVLYRGVNSIQATVDVGFDIFYCLAIILFSWAMLGSRIFHRAVGVLGLAAAGGLLTLNLWTFPRPPAEAGLVDLGPLTGVWWILVVVTWIRHERRSEGASADDGGPPP